MCLSTNLNDPHLARPVNTPPTGLSFQNAEAVLLEKIIFPKDVFPTTTKGRRVVLHSSQHCAKKPDQLSSMEAFLGLSNQILLTHVGSFFKPTQGHHKTVIASNRLRTPQSISTVLYQHQKAWWSLLFLLLSL